MEETVKMLRNQRLDAINRIKYESYEEFDESLFADVYERASSLTSFILEANWREECNEGIDRDFCGEEQYNNIISFLGERGMGKSSAMLSFALFLKEYDGKNIAERFRLPLCPQKGMQPVFYVLPRIDAAMLIQGENLMDIILAKMWGDFQKKVEKDIGQRCEWKEAEKCFEAVKKSYELYKIATFGKEDNNITSVRQLDELAKCLNLRNAFKELVKVYLEYIEGRCGNSFFVLAIDDLDVASGSVNDILEQIRLFLMVPRVIVLVTADYGRLCMEYCKFLSNSLLCPSIMREQEKHQIRDYTEKYLAKIFPGNMRVYMPRLNVAGGNSFILRVKELESAVSGDGEEWMEDKRALFLMIARFSDIMLNPFDNRFHILQKRSLRTIVNELFELKSLGKLSEQSRLKGICNWLRNALMDYGRMVEDEETYELIQALLSRGAKAADQVILEVLLSCIVKLSPEKAGKYRQDGGEASYSRILLYLHLLGKQGYHDFIHFVLMWYSVQLREASENLKKCRDVFYSVLEVENELRADRAQEKILDEVNLGYIEIVLAVSENQKVIDWIKDNLELICDAYRAANLGEWNLWYEDSGNYVRLEAEKLGENTLEINIAESGLRQEYYKKRSEGKAIIKIRVDKNSETGEKPSRTFLEMVLGNALEYPERLKGFLKNICRALLELSGQEDDPQNVDKLLESILTEEAIEARLQLTKFAEWRERQKPSCKDWQDLFPLESMEIMMYLTEEVCEIDFRRYNNNLLKRVVYFQNRQLETIISELEKIEEYYEPAEMKKYGYAVRLKELKDMVRPYDFGTQFMKMMSWGDSNQEDTSRKKTDHKDEENVEITSRENTKIDDKPSV